MQQVLETKVREITQKVVAALHPERVILFGSHAWGDAGEDSDVDLYVVVSGGDEPGYRLARKAYRALKGVKVPVDVVVRTRAESDRNASVVSSLDHEVLKRGLVLYG